jgi:hypothetical protein
MLDWITITITITITSDLGRRLSVNCKVTWICSVFKRLVKKLLLFPASLALYLSTFALK